MRILTIILLALTFCMQSPRAKSEEPPRIKVTGGTHSSEYVPIVVPYTKDGPRGSIYFVDDTNRNYPTTLRNGELVFVLEKLGAGEEITLTLVHNEGGAPQKVEIDRREGDILDVKVNGEAFTSYYYSNDNKKPYMYPILSEGGIGVTRDYPMKPEGTPKFAQDHPHHKSLWTSYGDINGADCWMEEPTAGFQHSGEVIWNPGAAYGWIHAKNVWQDNAHAAVVNEEREYRIYATPANVRLMDVSVTFTAQDGDVKFGDTKEGGIVSVRMRHEISGSKAEITNALGDKGEAKCWGKPSPWCDFSGALPEVGYRGITVMDNPANFRYPTSWHIRQYGLMGANCFGYSYFGEKEYNKGLMPANGDHVLKKGESLTFHYRVLIHSGNVDEAKVADRFADYATPPKAEWINQ